MSSKNRGSAAAAGRASRRAPQHRKDAGRHREPSATVADFVIVPASAGAKLAAVGVIGTSAAILTPAIASAAVVGPLPSTATFTGAQSPPAIVAQATSGGLATFPNGKIMPPAPLTAPAQSAGGTTGQAPSGGLAVFPNGKIMPSAPFTAPVQSAAAPVQPAAPAAGAETAPAPAGGSAYPMVGPVPIGDAYSFRLSGYDPVTHVGGTVAYIADPTGQTGGYLNIAAGLGIGGVWNGGYGPRAAAGFGPQIRVVAGDVTVFAQWNQMNGTLTVSPSYDIANGLAVGGTWLYPMYPGGPAPQFVATRVGAWYTFGAEASVNYGVTFPLPKGSQILDEMSRSSAIQMYIESGQQIPDELLHPAAPQAPPPESAIFMPDSSTLAGLQTFPAPSQGFPPVSDSSNNSGLSSLSPDQLSRSGPTPQQLMLNLTPTLTFLPPNGTLPPNSYFDNLGQLRQLGQPVQEPPTPAVPFDPASTPSGPSPDPAPQPGNGGSGQPSSGQQSQVAPGDGQQGGASQQQGGSDSSATAAASAAAPPVVPAVPDVAGPAATASVVPAVPDPAVPAAAAPAVAPATPAVPDVAGPAAVAPATPAVPDVAVPAAVAPAAPAVPDPAAPATPAVPDPAAPAAVAPVVPAVPDPAVPAAVAPAAPVPVVPVFSSTDLGMSTDPVGGGAVGGFSGGAGS
jgi:hypothetical protein